MSYTEDRNTVDWLRYSLETRLKNVQYLVLQDRGTLYAGAGFHRREFETILRLAESGLEIRHALETAHPAQLELDYEENSGTGDDTEDA